MLSSQNNKKVVIPANSTFDAANAILNLLHQQDLHDFDDITEVQTRPPPETPCHPILDKTLCVLTSPPSLPSPPASSTSSSDINSTSHESDISASYSTSDWFMSLSPLTSPDPTPPSTPKPDVYCQTLPKIHLSAGVQSTERKKPCSGFRARAPLQSESEKKSTKTTFARKEWRNANAKKARLNRRIGQRMDEDNHYGTRENVQKKYVEGVAAITTDFMAEDGAATSTTYTGLPSKRKSKEEYTLDQLVGENSIFNFRLQKWDGNCSMGILDAKNRVIGVLAGHPDDPRWSSMQKEAATVLEKKRSQCHIPEHHKIHRRGDFVTLDCGVSYGGGQKTPAHLHNNATNRKVLNTLNKMEVFQRIAGFSSFMATWAPKLHAHYTRHLKKMRRHHPKLTRIFPSCVFSGISYNFGPKTVSHEHVDNTNAAYGLCGVTPLGDFDYTKGGHLILWELRLVIEFPPGCTILIPSAIITHSNVKIGENEKRYSFVQYTAGSLFRWVDQKYQSKSKYLNSLSPSQLEEEKEKQRCRRDEYLSLFTTVSIA